MTTSPIQPIELHSVERLARDLVDIQEEVAALNERAAHLKAQIAEKVGVGAIDLPNGVAVTVREPNRRFNAERAAQLLAPEVLELCKSEGYDTKKLKSFLSPVLLEQVMEAGTGAPIVSVK